MLDAVEFLENSLLLTNVDKLFIQVLIHCVSGGSRSGCIAMAYLIKSRKISSLDAETEVINRRKMVFSELIKDISQ